MKELENIGRQLPYGLPAGSLNALQERILTRTTRRPCRRTAFAGRKWLAASLAAATVTAAAVLLLAEWRQAPRPAPRLDELIRTASDETLHQAAAVNYDDLLFNQQL